MARVFVPWVFATGCFPLGKQSYNIIYYIILSETFFVCQIHLSKVSLFLILKKNSDFCSVLETGVFIAMILNMNGILDNKMFE